MAEKITLAIQDARQLMRRQHSGILSTISISVTGYPFGSVTPFMLNGQGDLIIYASDIAQHARNMKMDPRVSLCVNDPHQSDSQANARVTVLGEAHADQVADSDKARYFRLFPQAKTYEQAHDFRFYQIKTTRVRYIGGFGEIYWFAKENWQQSFVDMTESEMGAIEHMHDDHMDALQEIAAFESEQKVSEEVHMLSIFHDGFHLSIDEKILFVKYSAPLNTPEELRQAIVEITHNARAENNLSLSA